MSTDERISLLERYVLAQDKEAFFATLVKNSTTYKDMRLTDSVNRNGLDLSSTDEAMLKEFLHKRENKNTALAFEARLMMIERETDEKKRKEYMSQFNADYMGCAFLFSRPPNARAVVDGSASGTDQQKDKSRLDPLSSDLQQSIEVFMKEKPWSDISKFRTNALYYFDYEALLKKHVKCLQDVMKTLPDYAHVPAKTFASLLKNLAAHAEAAKEDSSIPSEYLSKMTLEQLEEVKDALPRQLQSKDFVGELFRKTFYKDLRGVALLEEYPTPEAHREALLKMHAWAKKLPAAPRNVTLATHILREILHLDLRTNNIREETFLEYLKNPLSVVTGVFARGITQAAEADDWRSVHNFQRNRWDSERNLVTKYLQYLLKDAQDTRAFEPFFDNDYLKRQFYEARLYAGGDVPAAATVFTEAELTSFRESKELKFAPWCKDQFKAGESIDVVLQVKNVSLITVNVYVIDTETCYRRKATPITDRIDLMGLIPTQTTEHTFNEPPIVKHVLELKNLFEPKRGVYVVEFVGGGYSSRAVIRVGALTLIRRPLSKGILFNVVDETQSVCHSPSTAIILDGKEMKPDAKLNNGILIPYSTTSVNGTAIVCHDGFADLQEVFVPEETVAFDFSLLLNEESVVKGEKVQLLLMPTLSVCDQPVSLVSLKNVVVDVSSIDHDLVPSSQHFESVALQSGKSVSVNYVLPRSASKITVTMKAQFFSAAKGKDIDVTATEEHGVESQDCLTSVYLTQNNEEYDVHILGKNGEPYSKQTVVLNLVPRYLQQGEPIQLETDANGIVHLGAIAAGVREMAVSLDQSQNRMVSFLRTFKLLQSNAIDTLYSAMDAVENEDIVLPAPQNAPGMRTGAQYTLVEVCSYGNQSIVSSHTSKIEASDGSLVIKGLTHGSYVLNYIDYCKSVRIRVLKGKRWECSPYEYVAQENKIEKMGNQAGALACSAIKITDGNAEFVVRSTDLKAVEVHAFAYSFATRMVKRIEEAVGSLYQESTPATYNVKSGSCVFLSEKQLGDEELYVMNRKRRRPALGNTLEKPAGLLKRHFVRDTTQDDEVLRQEKPAHEERRRMAPTQPAPCCASAVDHRGKKRMMCRSYGGMPLGFSGDSIPEPKEFLVNNGWSKLCMAPDPTTGKVSFPVPIDKGFCTLLVVVRGRSNGVVQSSPLPFSARPLKSVSLPISRQANKVYVNERVAKKLKAGDVCELPDGANYYLADGVETVARVLKLIRADDEWDKWNFLIQWESLSPEERLKKYDVFMCHELNLFAYFKDPEFFNVVVKPHIQNKATKQLIDYLLLGTESELVKYRSVALLSKLSSIELALFVYFMREKEPELCSAIVRDMQARAAAIPEDKTAFERLFDCVLSGQQENSENDGPQPPMPPPMGAPSMYSMYGFGGGPAADGLAVLSANGMGSMFGSRGGRGGRGMNMNMNMMAQAGPAGSVARSAGFAAAPQFMSAAAQFDCADEIECAMEADCKEMVEVQRFQQTENTKEYIERQFYNSFEAPSADVRYWADAAAHFASSNGSEPFLSQNIVYAASNTLAESIMAISVLGVPLKASEHELKSVNSTLRITAGSTCMAFTKVLEDKGEQQMDLDILLFQRFYPSQLEFTIAKDGTKTLKTAKEFVVGEEYQCRVSVTNSTESQQIVTLVNEVPQGSIPMHSRTFTQTQLCTLEPLTTQVFSFFFYFPSEGEFTYFPSTVIKDGCLVATASGSGTIKVVRERTITEMTTFSDVLSQGSPDDILAFMSKTNLHNSDLFQFQSIYWLLNNQEFYTGVLKLLKNAAYFESTVWSFSIVHGDYDTFKEFLRSRWETVVSRIQKMYYVHTRDFELIDFIYTEYSPIVVARSHDVGAFKHNIRNNEFRNEYESFLTYMLQKGPRADSKDYLFLATYLFLQERLEDVEAVYPLIQAQEIDGEMKIQYDYLTAYLDIYQGYPQFAKARAVSMNYVTYPVFTWRNRFIDVLNLLAEFDGDVESSEKTEETDADKNQRLAKSEPYMACELKNKTLSVTTRNIESFTVNFHKIDMELLFSKDPFLSTDGVDCAFVLPTASSKIGVAEESSVDRQTVTTVDIPENLTSYNLSVHIVSGSMTENVTYLPSSMAVQVNRNFGLVKTLADDTQKPIPMVYVKAFAKFKDGNVKFFKDGYTDLRGSFEYASVNANSTLDTIAEFSILLCSAEHGAVIRRAPPPPTVPTASVKPLALLSTNMQIAQNAMAQIAANQYQF